MNRLKAFAAWGTLAVAMMASASALAQTEVRFARFFGACEADFGTNMDPSTPSNECGVITTLTNIFNAENPDIKVTVGSSGTGGGFEKFCAGETDISDASRPIKEDEEVPTCEENKVEYTELQVATDALTVVVNKDLEGVDCLTTDQLIKLWAPGSKINNWNQLDPKFPNQKIALFGPGADSGTTGWAGAIGSMRR